MDGSLTLAIGAKTVIAAAGSIVRLPANVPHALDTSESARMLLIMPREPMAWRCSASSLR